MYRRFFALEQILMVWLFILVSVLPVSSLAQTTICGTVFLDQNQNHVKDLGEPLRAGHSISLMDLTLLNSGQGDFFNILTGEDGQYCFLIDHTGNYFIFTDTIPTGMKLVTPVEAENAMPYDSYPLQITNVNQGLTIDFGFYGVIDGDEPIWGKCQDETKDDSVCVRNEDYIMQVTPNGSATEVKPMEVIQDNGVYRGDNNAAKVVTGENESGTRSARKTRDGSDDFSITVGKNISSTGEEVALDARVNPDDSVSFTDPEMPTVEVTAHADGSYTGLDSTSPSVAVAFDPMGNISATDSDEPTMSLFIDKATGEVTVTDSEYPTSMAVINSDGSRTITDEEFPNLIATVYANNEYVVQDLENNMVVHIDSQGNYMIIDNESKMCVVIPNTRGLLSKIWRGIKKVFRGVSRFIRKIAGFVVKVARFVVKVARVISVVARVIATIAKIAAVLFPPLCPLFCAVAAFAEGVARVSDLVGVFANKVALIAQGIQIGIGFWVGQQKMRDEINTLRKEKQEFEATVQTQATRIAELKKIVADQARRIQILEATQAEEIAALKEENARIQKEIDEQAEVNAALEDKIADLEEKLKKVEEEVETIPSGVPTVPTTLAAEVATLKEENARVQEEIAEQAEVNTALEERLKEAEDILDQFESGEPNVPTALRKSSGLRDETYDPEKCLRPPFIALDYLTASHSDTGNRVAWATIVEFDNSGFNVYRAEKNSAGELINNTKVNADLIPAQEGANWGATYSFEDTTALDDKTYYYTIEDVDSDGVNTLQEEFIAEVKPNPPLPAACLLYGVQDQALNDSFFFSYNPTDKAVKQIGEPCKGCDLEAMDIHPVTNEIYLGSGDSAFGHPKGHLYKLDAANGELHAVGRTSFKDISGLAFDDNGTLWAWAKGQGLATLDTNSGQGELVLATDVKLADLTWDTAQQVLYGVIGKELWRYAPANGEVAKVCDSLPHKTEAIRVLPPNILPEGLILLGAHNNKQLELQVFDMETCQAREGLNFSIGYDDVEGLAMPKAACQ